MQALRDSASQALWRCHNIICSREMASVLSLYTLIKCTHDTDKERFKSLCKPHMWKVTMSNEGHINKQFLLNQKIHWQKARNSCILHPFWQEVGRILKRHFADLILLPPHTPFRRSAILDQIHKCRVGRVICLKEWETDDWLCDPRLTLLVRPNLFCIICHIGIKHPHTHQFPHPHL